MRVKCIKEGYKGVTYGKEYDVVDFDSVGDVFIIDDSNEKGLYYLRTFEIVDRSVEDVTDNSAIKNEKVNHPSHYNKGIETIDYIESWQMSFNVGNVIKYTTRSGYKENALEDLLKAKWYIKREIDRLKKEEIKTKMIKR